MKVNETFINKREFQTLIMNDIMSGEYKKYIENSTYANSKDFEFGFMLGMNWAALLTTRCTAWFAEGEEEIE